MIIRIINIMQSEAITLIMDYVDVVFVVYACVLMYSL